MDQDDFKMKLKLWAKEQGIKTKDDEVTQEEDFDLDKLEDEAELLKIAKKQSSKKKVGFPDIEEKEVEEAENEEISKDVSSQITEENAQMI